MQSDTKKIGALMISVIANVSLIWIFVSSLLFPEKNIDFILKTGFLIFIIEFFSIHSSAFATVAVGAQLAPPWMKRFWFKVSLFTFYCLFVIVIAFVYNNWFLPFLFLSSLATKFFLKKAVDRSIVSMVAPFISIGLFVISGITIGFFLPSFFESTFPFPAEIMQVATEDGGGLFEEAPQLLLGWGVLYYSLSLIVDLIIFFVTRRMKTEQI
ncbi:MAG: hypothetical protein KKA62_06180 [Nanoarchaeota archaeon]|nr:hypothetical protein [Nanoarchaeota archaeon]MBU1644183.1 hypothetical protein [Nanoarchaeota archaeon]MBU1977512.1 hypothetical protein [Nanoarchaeota archaeon]